MEHQHDEAGWVAVSPRLRSVAVLLGASVNREYTVSEEDLAGSGFPSDSDGLFIRGSKNLVGTILKTNPALGEERYQIGLRGYEIRLDLKKPAQVVTAGSSVNVGQVLRRMGVSDLGIFGPVGSGGGGSSMTADLNDKGFELGLFQNDDGTAQTLTVRHPQGGSTLFCEKPSYRLSDVVGDTLADSRPFLLGLTGVKSGDLDLAELMYECKADVRVLCPHKEVFSKQDGRDRIAGLLPKTDLFHLNHGEASLLLGESVNVGNAKEMVKRVSKLGPKIAIITLGPHGAVMMEQGQEPVLQPAFDPPKPVDWSGVGDASAASFMYYAFLHPGRVPHRVCLQMSCWVAGMKLGHVGPWSGIPKPEELAVKLKEFMEE